MKHTFSIITLMLISSICFGQLNDSTEVAETFPRFPGCEEITDQAERQKCSEKKMLTYLYGNLKYPSLARENGIQGIAVIKFVIEKDGSMTHLEIAKDPGGKLGKAALDAFTLMQENNTWIPGTQNGEVCKVEFAIPVKFKLEENKLFKKRKKKNKRPRSN